MSNSVPVTFPSGATIYGIFFDDDSGLYYRPSLGTWVSFVSATAHSVAATYQRASSYNLSIPNLGTDRLNVVCRIYLQAGGSPADTDTEILNASFSWISGEALPIENNNTRTFVENVNILVNTIHNKVSAILIACGFYGGTRTFNKTTNTLVEEYNGDDNFYSHITKTSVATAEETVMTTTFTEI